MENSQESGNRLPREPARDSSVSTNTDAEVPPNLPVASQLSGVFSALNQYGNELSTSRKKQSWGEYVFGHETDKCDMIHPSSKFAQLLLFFSTTFLMYTAAVVPVVIAFLWNIEDDCYRSPLLEMDACCDSFFIVEIPINFCIAALTRQGKVIDSWREVAAIYLSGAFWFDLITSFPVSYIELYVQHVCSQDGVVNVNPDHWRFARLMKPLRFLRILRVARAMKQVDLTYRIEKMLRLQPFFLSLVRVVFGIFVVTHFAACGFWLIKVLTNTVDEVNEFLEGHGLDASSSVFRQYVLACYFIITIFTTVGFGDISATNTAEQIACIVLMMTGVCVFGTLLSEVQTGMAEMRRAVREKAFAMQQLKNFLLVQAVPTWMERKILTWADFEISVHQKLQSQRVALERMSEGQRLDMIAHMQSDDMEQFELLHLKHPAGPELCAHLWTRATSFVLEEGETIIAMGEAVNAMLTIQHGSVRVEDEEGKAVQVLQKGDVIAEFALVGDTDAASVYGFAAAFVALTHVAVMRITREDFDEVLETCPQELVHEVHAKMMTHNREVKQRLAEDSDRVSHRHRRARARWMGVTAKVRKRIVKARQREEERKGVRRAGAGASTRTLSTAGGGGGGHLLGSLAPSVVAEGEGLTPKGGKARVPPSTEEMGDGFRFKFSAQAQGRKGVAGCETDGGGRRIASQHGGGHGQVHRAGSGASDEDSALSSAQELRSERGNPGHDSPWGGRRGRLDTALELELEAPVASARGRSGATGSVELDGEEGGARGWRGRESSVGPGSWGARKREEEEEEDDDDDEGPIVCMGEVGLEGVQLSTRSRGLGGRGGAGESGRAEVEGLRAENAELKREVQGLREGLQALQAQVEDSVGALGEKLDAFLSSLDGNVPGGAGGRRGPPGAERGKGGGGGSPPARFRVPQPVQRESMAARGGAAGSSKELRKVSNARASSVRGRRRPGAASEIEEM